MTLEDGVFLKKRGRFNMIRSWGPIIRHVPGDEPLVLVASCSGCIFRQKSGDVETCIFHQHGKQVIENPSETPDWCTMKERAIADATDMINGTEHKIVRWSGMKNRQPRVIFSAIPSEAAREYRRTHGEIGRGWIALVDGKGKTLERYVKTEGPKVPPPDLLSNVIPASGT